jgi:amino acid transporter
MNAHSHGEPAPLSHALSLRDLVLFNIVAVLSLRWLATSAAAGPSALTLWILAALFFFGPLAIAVSYLSRRFPREGGLYFWTQRAFGDGHGFLCGWCYWTNNLLYPANLLMSTAVIATFVVGRGETGLGESWSYVLLATGTGLWIAVALNVVGVGTGKWLENLGGVAAYLPGLVLVALAAYGAATRAPASDLTPAALVPHLSDLSQLNLWASIAFAFSGIELASTMADEVADAPRVLPRSLAVSVPLIVFLYVSGTAAVLWLLPSGEINVVSGFLQAIAAGARQAGASAAWLAPAAAALYVLGNLGGVGAWLAGPARVAFVIGLDRYFPPAFGRLHPRWRTPHVAILTQGVVATGFLALSVLGEGTTVEKAYLVLLDTMILIYFIPYVYLFLSYLVFRRREARERGRGQHGRSLLTHAVGASGLVLTVFAMGVAVIPPPGTLNPWMFEAKVVGGALAFILLGGILYWRPGARRPAR